MGADWFNGQSADDQAAFGKSLLCWKYGKLFSQNGGMFNTTFYFLMD